VEARGAALKESETDKFIENRAQRAAFETWSLISRAARLLCFEKWSLISRAARLMKK